MSPENTQQSHKKTWVLWIIPSKCEKNKILPLAHKHYKDQLMLGIVADVIKNEKIYSLLSRNTQASTQNIENA